MTLAGKVALITGSTRGIGWATAQVFAGQGATVILNGHADQQLLDARVNELQTTHDVPVTGILCDAADAGEIQDCYQAIFKTYRRLDVLVNNAGVLGDALIGMIGPDIIRTTLGVNTVGVIHHIQSAARLMGRGAGGSIVNLSSIIGINGNAGQVVYAASKSALLGITRSAAKELAAKQIRVNAVAPGFIDTDMVRHLPAKIAEERMASIKMGRIGQPLDVANAILFFASDQSSYITGQVLGVDGGMVI